MKYRIAIQEVTTKGYEHKHNIVCETENEQKLIQKIRETLKEEIEKREETILQWLLSKKPDIYEEIIEEYEGDLIDWRSKGHDITKREYIENEIRGELDD